MEIDKALGSVMAAVAGGNADMIAANEELFGKVPEKKRAIYERWLMLFAVARLALAANTETETHKANTWNAGALAAQFMMRARGLREDYGLRKDFEAFAAKADAVSDWIRSTGGEGSPCGFRQLAETMRGFIACEGEASARIDGRNANGGER